MRYPFVIDFLSSYFEDKDAHTLARSLIHSPTHARPLHTRKTTHAGTDSDSDTETDGRPIHK